MRRASQAAVRSNYDGNANDPEKRTQNVTRTKEKPASISEAGSNE
jgi:hypothetical protein